jgi:outer membrane lipopolysaccharide assembly protein LptE/RlpB
MESVGLLAAVLSLTKGSFTLMGVSGMSSGNRSFKLRSRKKYLSTAINVKEYLRLTNMMIL